MNEIEKMLNENVVWYEDLENSIFFTTNHNGVKGILRLNDFPEEPLYTFYWKGEEIDIEERPSKWKFIYKSDSFKIV